MADLITRRDLPPGSQPRFWRDDDTVIVQMSRDTDSLAERRIIRDARQTYGVRRPGMLPLPVPGEVLHAARRHPTGSAAIAVVLAGTLAAGALYGTNQIGGGHHHRPPAVAGPAPTPGPSTTAPSHRRRTVKPPGVRPTAEPVADRPAPTPRPSPAPPGSPGGGPAAPTTPPDTRPPTKPTTTAPPAGRNRCLLHLAVLDLVDVRLLCVR